MFDNPKKAFLIPGLLDKIFDDFFLRFLSFQKEFVDRNPEVAAVYFKTPF